jgi:putative oxidoreductase
MKEITNAANAVVGNRYLLLVVRVVLGFLFVFASIEKISQPEDFAKAIMNYHLVFIVAVNLLTILLPWIELLAGLLLLSGILVRASSLLLSLLLCLFALAISISIARGLDISCGCFGTMAARKVGWNALGEDALMLCGALLLYFFPNTAFSLENYLRTPPFTTDTDDQS